MTKPLTWTETKEPPQPEPAKTECLLFVRRRGHYNSEANSTEATPADIASALNAAGAEVALDVWYQIHPGKRSEAYTRLEKQLEEALKCAEEAVAQRSAALKRAEDAEAERDEARAKLAEVQSRPRHEMTGWGDVDRARIADLTAALAALRDERRFALVCAALAGSAMNSDRTSDQCARLSIRDADAVLAELTTPVQPATPALAPDDAAELEAYRALMRWTQGDVDRGIRVEKNGAVVARQPGAIIAVSESPQALAAKLGVK